MKITLEEIKKLQILSALESSEEELLELVDDFESIALFVEQVRACELDEECDYGKEVSIAELREDEVRGSMDVEDVLSNAPEIEETFFVVPKVVD